MKIIFFLSVKNDCSGNMILHTTSATYIENPLTRESKPCSDICDISDFFFFLYLGFCSIQGAMENADSNMHHHQL